MLEKEKNTMISVEGSGGRFRWIAITALFLAIGMILRLVTPSVAGITPNWLISMYCLAILIIRPSLGQGVGIGLVAGAVSLATSKAIFPYASLGSELVGAVVCTLLVAMPMGEVRFKFNFKPLLVGLISTLCSGFTFVSITKIAVNVPMQVYLYGMLPVVLTVAVVNSVITQTLYFPANKLFNRSQAAAAAEDEKE